ncbi:MAG: ABC transporter permease subunit [Phycisphaerales bacterium]|nr:ABC transporter permease subunit [Phycisphaerales bacterium]
MPVLLRWLLRLGPINPIAVRLVQNGSRRTRHMYVRSAYLAVLIIVLLWSLLINGGAATLNYRDLAKAGATSFIYIAYLQIGLICVLAPVFMAGAIAQEASPRTWEVLLTTPLGAAEIVLGNLFGRLFFILALLLASLPLFALVQYFGGVPGRSIFASYLIAGCAAVLVGTIAIALAVSRLAGRRAVFAFYVSVVTYLAVTMAIDALLRTRSGNPGVTWMTVINPFLSLRALLNPSNYPRADEAGPWALQHPVTAWCYGSLGISLFLMLASTLTVRTGGLKWLAGNRGGIPWYRKIFGLGASGAEFRPPRSVWNNPIAWREAAARNSTFGRILARWSFVALGVALGIAVILAYHTGAFNAKDFQLALAYTLIGELIVIALVAINMSATAVSREREDGTLDLLLTTPITPKSYLAGKIRGLVAYLLPMLAVPLGTLALASLYAITGGLGRSDGAMVSIPQGSGGPPLQLPIVLPEAALLAPLVVLPFMTFCVVIGLQWSLKSKGTIASVVGAVGVVGVVSGVVGACAYKSGADVPVLGSVLAALSPATLVYSCIQPGDAMAGSIANSSLGQARVALVIGSAVAGAVYLAIVYGIQTSMVKNFDFTVRKLAGIK